MLHDIVRPGYNDVKPDPLLCRLPGLQLKVTPLPFLWAGGSLASVNETWRCRASAGVGIRAGPPPKGAGA